MSRKLTQEETEELKDVFSSFDIDNDGTITTSELGTAMRALGQSPSNSQLKRMIEEVDTDRSGTIEFSEFVSLMVGWKLEKYVDPESEMRNTFKVFDKNGDGYITVGELKSVMNGLGERLTEDEVNEMIRAADNDGDHRVNYDEFVKMMFSK